MDYAIQLDTSWLIRSARITSHSGGSTVVRVLEADGMGRWQIDGVAGPICRGAWISIWRQRQ